jgi:cytochrome c
VFAYCGACHSLRLVLQQRLSRDTWDDTLVYMVEEQAMPEIDPPDRKLVLDYLGKYLGRDVPRAIP